MSTSRFNGTKIILAIAALIMVPSAVLVLTHPIRNQIPSFELASREADIPTSIPLEPYFHQHDPRWADEILGIGPDTIAQSGSVLCCLSMCLAPLGFNLPPNSLNEILRASNGFAGENWLNWSAVETITGYAIRIRTPSAPSVALVRAALSENLPVIIMIRINNVATKWLLVVGFADGDFQVKDPSQPGNALIPLGTYKGSITAIRIPAILSNSRKLPVL